MLGRSGEGLPVSYSLSRLALGEKIELLRLAEVAITPG